MRNRGQRNRGQVRGTVFGLILAILMLAPAAGLATVKTAGVFGNNMVLQREMPVPVWGWAEPGETVTVTFAGQTKTAKADQSGKWMVRLDPMKANDKGSHLKISSNEQQATSIELKNVLVGEVWICSGQSNMEWSLARALNGQDEIAAATYPKIRLVTTPRATSPQPQKDVGVAWNECSPATAPRFSAVGYFFGRKLHKELDVPIGLINSSWGGTRVEPWTPPEGFRLVPELKDIVDNLDAIAAKSAADKKARRNPTMIYNAKIYPLIPYAIRGAIWYQGESNGGEGESYFHKKKALIEGWRKVWSQDISFYFVQLADFKGPNKNPEGGDGWAKLREAQVKTLTIPDTGMAVITDIGNASNIHPQNKQDVGYRLALWALAKNYPSTQLRAGGKASDLVYSGPLYKSHKVDGSSIRLSFDHVGSGLMVGKRKQGLNPTEQDRNGTLKHFAIAGKDKQWAWAEAKIDGDTVVVSSTTVAKPIAVRYAFAQNPEGANLYNKEGLPASPFRTDNW